MCGTVVALLGAAIVAAALVYLYLRSVYTYWARRGVPHERPVYLLGNLKGLGRSVHFRDVNRRIYERFKGTSPMAGVYYFTGRLALLLDLDAIKQVLIADFGNFHDRGIFSNADDDPLTAHLFTLEGEQWRALRQKLTPVFTAGKMKFMLPTVVAVANNLSCTCGEMLQAAGVDGLEVELKELCARYTTDVIGTCAFGIECNSLQDPTAEFRRRGRSIFEKPRHSQAVRTFMVSHPQLARRLHMKSFPDDVSEFFVGVVRRTVEQRRQHGIKRNDFMNLLIEMMAADQQAAEQSHGIDLTQGLTLLQMAAQAFVFFVAGFDTSSTTMSFCLYELALNPAIQERLRAEIEHVLKAHNGALTYEAISEMSYFDQVVAETLRKYPVVPHLVRKTVADYQLPDSGYTIERGVKVLIPMHAIHYDAALYPEPERFDPSRFEPAAVKERHPCAYLPFGDGPRSCIGLRFGKMQTKVGLISLLREFRFSRCDRTEVPVVLSKKSFLLSAQNGLHLRVERL